MDMSWRDAIAKVLAEEARPLHYQEISELILSRGYYKTEGATPDATVATLEALLIEALEPPQNRKRGDDFSVMEYIQGIDPEIEERKLQNTLRAIEQKLRGQT